MVKSAFHGWTAYYEQTVFPAAFGLSLLYMTVLGLDGITTGYVYSQGIEENILAVARGLGAVIGISGTVLYPLFRSRIGLVRTGLVSLTVQLLCLALCVLSIWMPGSPFDPFGQSGNLSVRNAIELDLSISRRDPPFFNSSIWVFILGVVLARCGLWMTDLSITQLMQESIVETERGSVNGVQSSLNQLLSGIKDVLVIWFPDSANFGLLILSSWMAVLLGFVSYCIFARQIRGHILPFHKQAKSVRDFLVPHM